MTSSDNPLKTLPSLMSQKAFITTYNVCRQAIKHSDNHPNVRKQVAQLLATLRIESRASTGEDSVEVTSLTLLLENTSDFKSYQRDKTQRDIFRLLKRRQITDERKMAADEIRIVWTAFGRILGMITSRYSSKLSKVKTRSTPPTPLDLMKDEELTIWIERYQPWYEQAHRKKIGSVSYAQLVLDCLLYDIPPEIIDQRERLRKGTARKILLKELDNYGHTPGTS